MFFFFFFQKNPGNAGAKEKEKEKEKEESRKSNIFVGSEVEGSNDVGIAETPTWYRGKVVSIQPGQSHWLDENGDYHVHEGSYTVGTAELGKKEFCNLREISSSSSSSSSPSSSSQPPSNPDQWSKDLVKKWLQEKGFGAWASQLDLNGRQFLRITETNFNQFVKKKIDPEPQLGEIINFFEALEDLKSRLPETRDVILEQLVSKFPLEHEQIGADIWMFPSSPWLYLQEPGPLFVRNSVRLLCQRLLQLFEKPRIVIVQGTPGIGKSVLTNWMVMQTRQTFADRDIHLFNSHSGHRRVIRANGECVEVNNNDPKQLRQFQTELEDPSSICFIDTAGDCYNQPAIACEFYAKGFVLVTSSPAASPKQIAKTNLVLFLPPWTWEECEAGHGYLKTNVSIKEVKRRFGFAGGIPRCLFSEEEGNYEKEARFALVDFVHKERLTEMVPHQATHKVFHLHPTEFELFDKYVFKFATGFVEDGFATEMLRHSEQKGQELFDSFVRCGVADLSSHTGKSFEQFSHQHLPPRVCYFLEKHCQYLQNEPQVCLSKFSVRVELGCEGFYSMLGDGLVVSDTFQESVYYVPKSPTHPVIDAWFRVGNQVFLFQMTVSKKRALEREEELTVKGGSKKRKRGVTFNLTLNRLEALNLKPIFIYVVPQGKIFDEFHCIPQGDLESLSVGKLWMEFTPAVSNQKMLKLLQDWVKPN